MKKTPKGIFLCLILLYCTNFCFGQTAFLSESIIKYDINTHTTDKPIPFDRAFTLEIAKVSTKDILAILGYEAEVKGRERILVENEFISPNDKKKTKGAVPDIELTKNPYSETLQIFFPPLKPNTDFDVKIIYRLSNQCKNLLMKVNAQLSAGISQRIIDTTYAKFKSCALDKLASLTAVSLSYNDYKSFYNSELATHYSKLSNASNFLISGNLNLSQVQAMDIGFNKDPGVFQEGQYLVEAVRRGLLIEMQNGNRNITTVFSDDEEALTNLHFAHYRLQNLDSNIVFFERLLKKANRLISKGITIVNVTGTNTSIEQVRTDILLLLDNMRTNFSRIEEEFELIESKIDKNMALRQSIQLVGNTLSSDLKSAGKSVLFIDAGLANIFTRSILDKPVYIPKLYWGVSIYFRPIDKNTRRNRFPTKEELKPECGCKIDGGIEKCGPDYGMVTKRSILQHLSLNVGITIGDMSNKEFGNFYNNTSLLIGPAIRFKRAFKLSAGVALMRRTSKNPFVSDMQIIPGGYVSASVDIDFIEGIKNVTSLFFK